VSVKTWPATAGRRLAEIAMRAMTMPLIAYFAFVTRGRRMPNLQRIVRKPEFQERRAAAIGWVEGQFRQIESGLGWLDRAGDGVADECEASRSARGWVTPHSEPWHVRGIRTVKVVYGASGDPATELGELAEAAGAAGWGYSGTDEPTARLRELLTDPFLADGISDVGPHWLPRPGLVLLLESPATIDQAAHVYLTIHAERASTVASERWREILRDAQAPPVATSLSITIELSQAGAAEAALRVLARSSYMITLTIQIVYYAE
jgi:hypothetical protein